MNLIRLFFTFSIFLMSLLSSAQLPEFDWAIQIDASYNEDIRQDFLSVDSEGNIYVAGELGVNGPPYNGTVDFSSGNGSQVLYTDGGHDYIAKYDRDWNLVWAGTYETYRAMLSDIAIAPDSTLIVSGSFRYDVDLQLGNWGFDSQIVDNGTQARDAFLAKYSSEGELLWHITTEESSHNVVGGKIALDEEGNIYQLGTFADTVDFDFGPGTSLLVAESNFPEDIFLRKLDSDGNFLWVRHIPRNSGSTFNIRDIEVSPILGDVFIAGGAAGEIDVNPNQDESTLFESDDYVGFVLKWNTDGEYEWINILESDDNSEVLDIEPDMQGNVFCVGQFEGDLELNPLGEQFIISGGSGSSSFIAEYGSQGTLVQGYLCTTEDEENSGEFSMWLNHIAIDVEGGLYIQGRFNGTTDFSLLGNGQNEISTPSSNGTDSFMAKYNSDMGFEWYSRLTINDSNKSISVTGFEVDNEKSLITSGQFSNTLVFPDYSFEQGFVDNYSDGLILKHSQCNYAMEFDESACDEYTLNGNTITESGEYTSSLISSLGCDSLVTVNLTINLSTTFEEDVSECSEYFWETSGETYTEAGTYTTMLATVAGCDSLVTLNLELLEEEILEETSVCDSLVWNVNGQTYFETGVYEELFTNTANCDSLRVLELEVRSSTSSDINESSCESYFWDDANQEYFISGSYQTIITNTAGCDSTITLDLEILEPSVGEINESACSDFTWDVNGQTYSTSGSYEGILENMAGCDSVVTLNLEIQEESHTTETAACFEYLWDVNGTTYDESGTFSEVFTNTFGCDSVEVLELEILDVDTAVSVLGATLIAASSSADYQWLDCNNDFEPISGATNQEFSPEENGLYALSINENGCQDTSACYLITTVGLTQIDQNNRFVIYPNPTSGKITVDQSKSENKADAVTCVTPQGEEIFKFELVGLETVMEFPYANGVYFLRFEKDGSVLETVRIVKVE